MLGRNKIHYMFRSQAAISWLTKEHYKNAERINRKTLENQFDWDCVLFTENVIQNHVE